MNKPNDPIADAVKRSQADRRKPKRSEPGPELAEDTGDGFYTDSEVMDSMGVDADP